MSFNETDRTEILRAVKMPIANQEYCRKRYEPHSRKITDRMICAGYKKGGKSPCYGDSGGPFVVKFQNDAPKLIGIVSWGMLCAMPKYPGVFARVSSVRPWIQSISGI